MVRTILLCIAIVLLTINIILTIKEALLYYPFSDHPGRIRGACAKGRLDKGTGWVEIDGMKYNVEWYIIGRKGKRDGV